VNEFERMGLCEPLLKAVQEAHYTEPTEIQRKAIPVALTGRDLIGCAQTGSGKTAAFLLPALQRWHLNPEERPQLLVLAPTRELTAQIEIQMRLFARHLPVKCAAVVGGASMNRQIQALRSGVDFLAATPGRLEDLWQRGFVKMPRVRMVVLDEADRMLDMGFEPQVRRILARISRERQTLLFSATMPREMELFAADYLRDPIRVDAQPPCSTVATIEQWVHRVAPDQKQALLLRLLESMDVEAALIFTRTKRGADRLHRQLQKSGHAAERIHGDMRQSQRETALNRFRNGGVKLLIATDLAARGLDIPRISHVINYDVPQWAEDYVHRIGRTGRAGRAGVALTLASQAEASYLAAIERLIGEALPAQGAVSGFDYKPDFSQPERNRGADRKTQNTLDWLSNRYPSPSPRTGAVAASGPSRRGSRR
jgi:ATP-dependent RNA helicase RhlE